MHFIPEEKRIIGRFRFIDYKPVVAFMTPHLECRFGNDLLSNLISGFTIFACNDHNASLSDPVTVR
jgi:hypothetical protein